jgi:hypothetical protein
LCAAAEIYRIRGRAGINIFQVEFDAIGATHGIARRNPYLQKEKHKQQATAEGFSVLQHDNRVNIPTKEVKISSRGP